MAEAKPFRKGQRDLFKVKGHCALSDQDFITRKKMWRIWAVRELSDFGLISLLTFLFDLL